jgi:hypothetical protein
MKVLKVTGYTPNKVPIFTKAILLNNVTNLLDRISISTSTCKFSKN